MCQSSKWSLIAVVAIHCSTLGAESPNTSLSTWQRGLSVDSKVAPTMRMYVWFYEWQLFDAVEKGQMTSGVWTGRNIVPRQRDSGVISLDTSVTENRLAGRVVASDQGLRLDMQAVDDGAELTLTVTNRSDHDWPALAAVIPCFNPGPSATRNKQFANANTYFNSIAGLWPLTIETPREMHFNRDLRTAIDAEADSRGKYSWTFKWPKSKVDAVDGLIIRESNDGRWVTGIAWERFLAAQGHNPWQCMHLSIRVGPLKRGDSRKIRGKIYLFQGRKEDLLSRYQHDSSQWQAN